jgi:hypothetical protein
VLGALDMAARPGLRLRRRPVSYRRRPRSWIGCGCFGCAIPLLVMLAAGLQAMLSCPTSSYHVGPGQAVGISELGLVQLT